MAFCGLWILQSNLFSFFLNVNEVAVPIGEVGSDEAINLGEEMGSDDGGADKGKQCPPHVLVGGAMNSRNVTLA